MLMRKSSLSSASSMMFKVRRSPAKIVAPAGPTPHELKLLSDIDDQPGIRLHVQLVHFYSYNPSMAGKDPVHIIKEALSKVLVFYYPLAGRLREGTNGKLMVDCTAEGVLFIEADADVTLDQFGVDIMPPFPCSHELLYLAPSFDKGIINTPLLLIQVTRLKCGGFIFAIRTNHTMYDGAGMGLFLNAIAEIAQVHQNLPSPQCGVGIFFVPETHQELHPSSLNTNNNNNRFMTTKVSLPPKLARLPSSLAQKRSMHCATSSLLTLLILSPPLRFSLHSCGVVVQLFNPPLPEGYYGNTFVVLWVVSTVGMLCGQPLSYALESVKKSKNEASEEYVHSTIDRWAVMGKPPFTPFASAPETFVVSDNKKSAFRDVDFGWGKPLYSGLAEIGNKAGVSCYFAHTNSKGEHGRLVFICLLEEEMKRFQKELNGILPSTMKKILSIQFPSSSGWLADLNIEYACVSTYNWF
ncbi:hypothetical protein PIB30_015803 [Stylosanthes scabra]|uniref:Uncharacterized protein n=1 Tax=Stylosanthes scabra TaxID=79078 RepID=A0ABU6Q735_9FABA|nr:hypothetical protein [Stylosanthes scabra]